MDKLMIIGAFLLLVIAFAYGVWVGETDKKEGRDVNDGFGV